MQSPGHTMSIVDTERDRPTSDRLCHATTHIARRVSFSRNLIGSNFPPRGVTGSGSNPGSNALSQANGC